MHDLIIQFLATDFVYLKQRERVCVCEREREGERERERRGGGEYVIEVDKMNKKESRMERRETLI